MRKPDNKRPGARGGDKFSKTRDSSKGERKSSSRPYSDRPKRRSEDAPAGTRERSEDADKKPRRSFAGKEERRPAKKEFTPGKNTRRSFGDAEDKPRRSFRDKEAGAGERPRSSERTPFKRDAAPGDRGGRKFGSRDAGRPGRKFERDAGPRSDEKKPFRRGAGAGDKDDRRSSDREDRKPVRKFDSDTRSAEKPARFTKDRPDTRKFKKDDDGKEATKRVKYDDFEEGRAFSRGTGAKAGAKKPGKKPPVRKQPSDDGKIRLNKYLSNAGVASRRDADTLIQSGAVKVNGVVIDQLGYRINPGDKVTYGDAAVKSERKVYLLLNKPKDYITTLDDPQERKTVMELVAGACRERIYPVGRLDRNTTGLLLFTNDGELATKLMHPKFNIRKVYHVSLNKGLKPDDFRAITEGVELEDGPIKADDLAFVGEGKKEIGIEVHSGRNRIVRRLFEHLGYDVLKLDRVSFAGLTKKDLPRGKHRFLTAKEIGFLQMIG